MQKPKISVKKLKTYAFSTFGLIKHKSSNNQALVQKSDVTPYRSPHSHNAETRSHVALHGPARKFQCFAEPTSGVSD